MVAEPEPKLRPARRRRRLVLPVRTVVVAVGLLAVVVAGAMMINTPGTPHSAAPALAGPTRLTAPTRTITVVPDATDARAFLTHYYSLLPGRLDAAMGLLTGRYLAKVGGARAFRGFYATIASVRVRAVNVLTARTATAILVFHRKDGVTSVETYRFTLVVRAGTVLIDDAQLIG